MPDPTLMQDVRGAVYFPARAYNAYQTWLHYSPSEIRRDFGYAKGANLNALRIFASYEFWREAEESFWSRFEDMLCAAQENGIRVMPILFEDCGRENTPETARDTDPMAAVCVRSPDAAVEQDEKRWPEAIEFIDAFFARYKDDARLLAIEIMNEPHRKHENVAFAQHITHHAAGIKGSVPITIGCIFLWHNMYFGEDVDIFQFHDNFPTNMDFFRAELAEAAYVQKMTGKPCWISEWQRLRPAGPGWDQSDIPEDNKTPDLSSLAQEIHESGLGNFFWSLMVKPAYLPSQRLNGTFNGLFHEDGRVYSADDFRAISGKQEAPVVLAQQPQWYLDAVKEAKKGQ